jgi:hypothetical protein
VVFQIFKKEPSKKGKKWGRGMRRKIGLFEKSKKCPAAYPLPIPLGGALSPPLIFIIILLLLFLILIFKSKNPDFTRAPAEGLGAR